MALARDLKHQQQELKQQQVTVDTNKHCVCESAWSPGPSPPACPVARARQPPEQHSTGPCCAACVPAYPEAESHSARTTRLRITRQTRTGPTARRQARCLPGQGQPNLHLGQIPNPSSARRLQRSTTKTYSGGTLRGPSLQTLNA